MSSFSNFDISKCLIKYVVFMSKLLYQYAPCNCSGISAPSKIGLCISYEKFLVALSFYFGKVGILWT